MVRIFFSFLINLDENLLENAMANSYNEWTNIQEEYK